MLSNIGLFFQPSHPPERSPADAQAWDLDVIEHADKLGFSEAWIGEHHTLAWEPNPAPDILIAQAIPRTKSIRLGAAGHLLPYYNPIALANRVSYLDQLSGGRMNFGTAASGVPTDLKLFNVDGASGQNREMTDEALEIIEKYWTDEGPWQFRGKYWSANSPETRGYMSPHIKPVQQPHPPIAVTGITPGSKSLRVGGARGYIPISFGGRPEYLASHWESVVEGAQEAGRAVPSRNTWRVTRDIFVAETDEEAYELTVNGMLGRKYNEYYLDLLRRTNFMSAYNYSADMSDDDVDVDYIARTSWFIGAPDTVAQKIFDLHDKVEGFGTMLMIVADYLEHREEWMKSMTLLAEEVMPRVDFLLRKSGAAPIPQLNPA